MPFVNLPLSPHKRRDEEDFEPNLMKPVLLQKQKKFWSDQLIQQLTIKTISSLELKKM